MICPECAEGWCWRCRNTVTDPSTHYTIWHCYAPFFDAPCVWPAFLWAFWGFPVGALLFLPALPFFLCLPSKRHLVTDPFQAIWGLSWAFWGVLTIALGLLLWGLACALWALASVFVVPVLALTARPRLRTWGHLPCRPAAYLEAEARAQHSRMKRTEGVLEPSAAPHLRAEPPSPTAPATDMRIAM